MGLLKLYKVYAPHLVVISVPTSRTVFFRATDRKLMADIREAQERIRQAEGTLGADITEKSEEEGRKVSHFIDSCSIIFCRSIVFLLPRKRCDL